jgi:membrane-bound lytic murein transglycosylase A
MPEFQAVRGLLLLLAFVALCLGCQPEVVPPVTVPQLVRVSSDEAKAITMQLQSAPEATAEAMHQSLDFLSVKRPDEVAVMAGETAVTYGMLKQSVTELQTLLPDIADRPDLLHKRFTWYELAPSVLLTGYYEPLLNASLEPDPAFPHPIYRVPGEMKRLDLGMFRESLKGQSVVYRVEDGEALPYHTRQDIDFENALAGQGLEIAWVESAFDLFILHVQGSGRLELADGKVKHVLYAGQNGHPYVSLGRAVADAGLMELSQVSLDNLRQLFSDRPELIPEFFPVNPSYVFFRLADKGPFGAMGRTLTPMASLAVDRRIVPLGAPLVLSTALPTPDGPWNVTTPFVRIMAAQDTGGAIKGGRADLFCGFGPEAEGLAGRLKHPARLFVLLSNEALQQASAGSP